MANHALDVTSKIVEVTKDLKDNVESLREHADRMANKAGREARYYFDGANYWLRRNYGKTLAVAGALTAAGLLGYFFSRRNK